VRSWKRWPGLQQLATIRGYWRRAPALTPLSRLKLGACWALPRLAPADVRLSLETGSRVTMRWRSSDQVVFEQIFIHRHYDLPLDAIRPVRLIVDAGAYTGLSTVFFADKYRHARVIAIEPDPTSFALLLRNTAQHENVTAVNAALWFEPARLTLGTGRDQGAWSVRATPAAADQPAVRSITMGEVIERYCGEAEIDLLKLDIEGAERDVLAHSSGWIERVRAIAAELHPDLAPDVERVFDDSTRGFTKSQVEGHEVVLATQLNPAPSS
jgi:FkbM family methyltransferase